RPTVHLPDVRAPLVAREGLEALGLRVEPDDRVRAPLAQPHLVLVVDINRVGLRPVARQLPRLPGAGPGIVATDVPAVPFADPDLAARVRPNTSRALSLGRRLDDRGGAGLDVDPRDVTASEGGVVDGAVGGRRDAIGPTALGRVPDLHRAALRVEASVYAVLSREPDAALLVERGGGEVDVAARLG